MGGELIQSELPGVEAGDLLSQDSLFRELVVQRSRAYVKQSQITAGAKEAMFPKREAQGGRLLGQKDLRPAVRHAGIGV